MDSKDVLKSNNTLDMNEVEMIFGTPSSPKQGIPDVHHMITNERKHGKETHSNKDVTDEDADTLHSKLPLLEPERERQIPPLAGPEVDDLDGDPPRESGPYPGVDDGLLEPEDKVPEGHDNEAVDDHKSDAGDHLFGDGGSTADDGINGFANRFDDRPISPMVPGTIIPDVNTYQQKKNLAQGMMDLALLSANANQLRYVLESSSTHPYYYPSLVFISLSIIFQVAVGVGLIMNSRYDVNHEKDICKADKINNFTVLGVFLVTIVNVFITSFSVATSPVTVVQPGG